MAANQRTNFCIRAPSKNACTVGYETKILHSVGSRAREDLIWYAYVPPRPNKGN